MRRSRTTAAGGGAGGGAREGGDRPAVAGTRQNPRASTFRLYGSPPRRSDRPQPGRESVARPCDSPSPGRVVRFRVLFRHRGEVSNSEPGSSQCRRSRACQKRSRKCVGGMRAKRAVWGVPSTPGGVRTRGVNPRTRPARTGDTGLLGESGGVPTRRGLSPFKTALTFPTRAVPFSSQSGPSHSTILTE